MRDLDVAELLVGGGDPIIGTFPLIAHFLMQFGRDDQDVLLKFKKLFPFMSRDLVPEELAGRSDVDVDHLITLLSNRDVNLEELEARSFGDVFKNLFGTIVSGISKFIRDIDPEDLAARSAIDDFIPSLNAQARSPGTDGDPQDFLVHGIAARAPASGDLFDLQNILKSVFHFPRDVLPKTAARDGASELLTTLLQSREVTPLAEQLVTLAKLASRSFDGLD